MALDWRHALSGEQREDIDAALAAVLGSTPVDNALPVSGGVTAASIFRVDAAGHRYLLRLEGPASPLRNPHQYASLRIASEAGIAPKLHHVDEERRVAVMDYIEQRPLQTYPGGPQALARALGVLLRRLQETPVFPRFVDYPDIVARLFAHVRRTGLFAEGLLDRHTGYLEQISSAYFAEPFEAVSCHNDANPRNILFDGQRLWLVDWESAYCNDPLIDAAVILDCLPSLRRAETVLLEACTGRPVDDILRHRLDIVRALTRLYFAGVLLSASALVPRSTPETDLSALAPRDFQDALEKGLIRPGTPETKHILGKMYLESFMTGAPPPGLDAAV